MKHKLLFLLLILAASCAKNQSADRLSVYHYPNIIDIRQTPTVLRGCQGLYTEAGAWMGFAVPADSSATGFVGPFDIDNRNWISRQLIGVEGFELDSSVYYPGQICLFGHKSGVAVTQRLFFVDAHNALVLFDAAEPIEWAFSGHVWDQGTKFYAQEQELTITMPRGEVCRLQMPSPIVLNNSVYTSELSGGATRSTQAVISFCNASNEVLPTIDLTQTKQLLAEHESLWSGRLKDVLRMDMPQTYDRVAVKSLVTLVSNWRTPKGDLFTSGIVPSHAVNYFVGFWAWDSFKHAVAVARWDLDLAKDQIRTMFDYQDSTGMVIDCIYSDRRQNNARDSKPPLAAWAVKAVVDRGDTLFLKEMYPKLLEYYKWWFAYRDHNGNGMCEFGSTDGTTEAAKWESGMDNAVRYDDASMVKNSDGAWSFDQESVDLNAYLSYECSLLQEFASILGEKFEAPLMDGGTVSAYFFDVQDGFFYDKRLDGTFVRRQGPEAFIPLWAGIASKDQVSRAIKILSDTSKFSTYIPMPTVAADDPGFTSDGYWRGPIWLDQVYFGISGIRRYGYSSEADKYTDQVFTRLDGLMTDGSIHENYDTQTGGRLKAPHFSWSAAHLLMLYWEYGK